MTSLFRKTMLAYLSVVVLTFAALFITLHFEIRHFLVQQKVAVMDRESQELLPYIEQVTTKAQLSSAFGEIVRHNRRVDKIAINVLLFGHPGASETNRLKQYLIRHNQIVKASQVSRVLNGQRVEFIGAFSTAEPRITVTVGWPVRQDGRVVGALFLHTAIQNLHIGEVTRAILLITAPLLLLSVILLYIAMRRFLRPLTRVTRAAQAIGEGRFGERVKVQSRDEVGQLAAAFNEMAAKLERLEAMRSELVANVSHELRTPLTSVKGFIQGILEGVIPPADQHRYLTTAYAELERLNNLLHSMLDLAAIESGHVTLRMASVPWKSVVQSAYERVKVRLDEKGIAWRTSQDDESVMVWGDPERLEQILFNLLDNAIRHTAHGEIAVCATLVDGQLHVQITDTGEGIPREVLPHVWERFYSRDPQGQRRHGHGGLGLPIARQLVELMNGRIDVASTPGKGTTFTLRLPTLRRGGQ